MLPKNMTLKQMLNFSPNLEDMALLPLNVKTYLKVIIIGNEKEINYHFLKYFFSQDINNYFHKLDKTIIYDFDLNKSNQNSFINIIELYSILNYEEIAKIIEDILNNYEGILDIIFDLYTHDLKLYRLSYMDELVQLEEVKEKIELKF